jgi:hypothetical protein
MRSNVGELVETLVEVSVEHVERNMAATPVGTVRVALRRRYKAQLSMTTWRGYANLLLDKTKYAGMGRAAPKRAKFRQTLRDRGMHESMPLCGWLTRWIPPYGMPSYQVAGTVGVML